MLEWTGERFWYGSKVLSEAASSVVAVDIDENSLGGLCSEILRSRNSG